MDHALPLKTMDDGDSCINNLINDELPEDCESLIRAAEAMQLQLNKDQRIAFNSIIDQVRADEPGFFLFQVMGYWKNFPLERSCFLP